MTAKQQRHELNHGQSTGSRARLVQISNPNRAAYRGSSPVNDLHKKFVAGPGRQKSMSSQHIRIDEMLQQKE